MVSFRVQELDTARSGDDPCARALTLESSPGTVLAMVTSVFG